MELEIVTPDRKVFQGSVTGVQVPGVNGSFEVLNKHIAIVSTLQKGTVRVNKGGSYEYFAIDGGVIEVLDNKIIVLAESAEAVK
jgi:F-type H+-transporting ATPase subunit epsilon